VPYSVSFLKTAVRNLAALPKTVQLQVTVKIDELASTPLPHGVQKLHGEDKLYRIRIGDYRVLYEVDHQTSVVTIIMIGHRRDVYRR
jgi:mRNA interferase RelE/StbE